MKKARENIPPIDAILNLQDMEDLAEKVMSTTGWAYYRSAADTEESESIDVMTWVSTIVLICPCRSAYRNNEDAWKRYFFRPRV